MKVFKPYMKVFALGVVVLGLLAVVQTAYEATPRAVAGQGGIRDAGVLSMETNKKLGQINTNLKSIDTKLQSLLDLLKGGKVQVVVREAPAKSGTGSSRAGK
jgi:predicted methyltransferase MtxX (methanogen marker protein 4)